MCIDQLLLSKPYAHGQGFFIKNAYKNDNCFKIDILLQEQK